MRDRSVAQAQIVVVEDDSMIAEYIHDVLEDLEYSVPAIVATGEEAIRTTEETRPDLVLMDIVLKGRMDGIETAEQIRARFNIPVVYLTAYGDSATLGRAKATEPYGYVLKPFEEQELHAAIEVALYKHQMEMRLKESEQRFAATLRCIADAVIATDRQGCVIFMNAVAEEMTNWKQRDAYAKDVLEIVRIVNAGDGSVTKNAVKRAMSTAAPVSVTDHLLVCRDGRRIPVDCTAAPVKDEHGTITGAVLVARDVSERQRAQAELRESEERFRLLVEGVQDYAIIMLDPEGRVVSWNAGAERIKGYRADEIIGSHFSSFYPREERRLGDPQRELEVAVAQGRLELQGWRVRKDRSQFWADVVITTLRNERGDVSGFAKVTRDITERKAAEDRIHRQMQRLAALRSIDMAITGSLELGVTLNIFLDQVTTQLDVDAAAVLVRNPFTQSLEYKARRGFRFTTFPHAEVRLGEGPAGRAALERRLVSVPDLAELADPYIRARQPVGEDFCAYYAVPLVAKGQVKGVLEVFNRSRIDPDPEWLEFLQTLAGQAAIAIDNAALFDDLQRSNVELTLAYDTTLEGWSHALELRDAATEGHTRRVAEMSVRLGRAIGMSEAELVHVRRGALLHDIGKMGIPDSILLKPGPLTEQEWEIMRLHPRYAFELLHPIPFLRSALDIPYCHHERWDGSGYPRGLKGEQIPLAARVFAVVDVWDALSCDRPYSVAWSEADVLRYVRSASGSHFDPRVVQAFVELQEGERRA